MLSLFVGAKQLAQALLSFEREIFSTRKQRIALALDERAIFAREALVLAAPDRIEGIAEVAHDVKFVVDDPRALGVLLRRVAKRRQHVHDGELDALALLRTELLEEQVEIRLGTTVAADPDRPLFLQIADDDAILVALAHGDLIDADHSRCERPGRGDLLLHVDLVQVLHRAVVQVLQLGDCLVRHLSAERPDVHRVARRVARILRQPVEPLYEHVLASRAAHPPPLELDVDSPAGHWQITRSPNFTVVPTSASMSATRADGSFFRRRRTMTRAYRSPLTPRSPDAATKPGNENKDRSDFGLLTTAAYLVAAVLPTARNLPTPIREDSKKTLVARERDRPDVEAKRRAFIATQPTLNPAKLVFLDESGFRLGSPPNYGWAPVGEKSPGKAVNGDWCTMTMIGALALDGWRGFITIDAATDGDVFLAFVEQELAPNLRPGDLIVMDNLNAHKRPDSIAAIRATGADVLFLPPYSPEYNPIEKAWAKLKEMLRRQRLDPVRGLRPHFNVKAV